MPIVEPRSRADLQNHSGTERGAGPPSSPLVSQAQLREERRAAALRSRLGTEQRSLLRGLVLLALAILFASLTRAGFDRLFVPGWWRQW
jgi:hypothetical protein